MRNILELKKELYELANPRKAKILQGFFKTGKGEYGEGDIFLGVTVPVSRKIAIKFKDLDFVSVKTLLKSKIHEERLIALLILVHNFEKGDENLKKKIYDFYLGNTKHINNWDLVDLSADKIVGGYLLDSQKLFVRQPRVSDDARLNLPKKQSNSTSLSKIRHPSEPKPNFNSSESGLPHSIYILIKLANSKNIWERRIAIVATYYFIKNKKFDATLKVAEILLQDKHDLIQKAVGWMLREVGKRDLQTEIKFLDQHYKKMSRTMLSYAIERFPGKLRMDYLKRRKQFIFAYLVEK